MKFKAQSLATLILTAVLVVQTAFVQETGARAGNVTAQSSDAERIARLETLLENLRH